MSDLRVVPPGQYFDEYSTMYVAQYGIEPMRSDKMLMVADSEVLVAGCSLISTSGPFIIVSCIITDVSKPAIDRYNALVFLQHEIKKLASILDKIPLVLVDHDGTRAVLARNGYAKSNSDLWYYTEQQHVQPVKQEQQEQMEITSKTRKRGRPKGSRNRAKQTTKTEVQSVSENP